jgi:peptide/nickel transport system substrate-binding protein
MKRRMILKSAVAAAASTLAAPNLAGAQTSALLKFVPQGDLALLDPVQTTLFVTRHHGLMVFDTLYGVDENWKPQPQMVEGHVIENDGKTWKLTLREGLKFHDNTPVLARDVVASLQRWGKRDSFGLALMAVTDELSAPSDKEVMIRLRKPFPLMPDALGKTGSNIAVIMPERLARTDPFVQVTEMVGSGPYKFIASERVPGSRAVYERFAGYVPRPQGTPSNMAGPKVVYFDRVEWLTIPEAATAAAALQTGEVDWWEQPTTDFWSVLKGDRNIIVDVTDRSGSLGFVRFNFLNPPYDNPAVRRAAMAAISQSDVMQAMAGTDPSMWRDKVGFFLPDTPMASDAGMAAVPGPVDIERCRRMMGTSGYNGEKLVFIVSTDYPSVNAEGQVVADAWGKVGFKVEVQTVDGGTAAQRLTSKQPVEKGGWNAFCAYTAGVNTFNPAAHNYIRGSGKTATFGWPDIPRLEELRNAWFDAPDQTTQAALCREMQVIAFETVPYIPTGVFYQPTAYLKTLTGVPRGFAQFYGVRRV